MNISRLIFDNNYQEKNYVLIFFLLQGQSVPVAIKKSLMILEPVTKACPGLKDALYLLSRAKFLSGKFIV